MKFLFVSLSFIAYPKIYIHGVYKRMHMFVDGIKDIAGLDVLFYVPPDFDVSPSSVSQLEQSLSDHWNTRINLFLCPVQRTNLDNEDRLSRYLAYGAAAFSIFKQSVFHVTAGRQQVQALEACLQRKPDAIFAHKLGAMCPLMLMDKTLPPIYFDLDDIEHIVLKRNIRETTNWKIKLLSCIRFPMFLLGELRAIRFAHKTFVCSELDRNYLTKHRRLPGIVTIPNAVSIPEKQSLTLEPTMLFVGSYMYKPNIDAAEFLIHKVWPGVYKIMPSAKLFIAGIKPERVRGYQTGIPGVTFTGFVEDIEALYEKSKVVCTPIFTGGGTRLKIIEAAAYGKAVISTRIGAEGLDMRDGHELLLRDDVESFTEACLLLLRDRSLCERLGSAARSKAIQSYDRNNVVQLIQKYLTN